MKLPQNDIKKIAVFRALQLGDLLCVIPSVRALRKAYPNAKIFLLGLPWAGQFTKRFKAYFDGFIHFPGYPGLPEQNFNPASFPAFLQKVQDMQFDLVLQMQGNGSIVNPMVELFNARYTSGFSFQGHYAPDNGLFIPYPEEGHEILRHLQLINHLGIPAADPSLEFPLYDADIKELRDLKLAIASKNYVCIHPGSRGVWRQWPAKYFALLGDYCSSHGYKVVLTGTADEHSITESVQRLMKFKAINAAGKTSLGAIGLLIREAALLISNCTGVSHIAAALQTPSIVLSMDGEPQRWGPLDGNIHRTINWLETPVFDVVLKETEYLMKNQRGVDQPHWQPVQGQA